MQYRFAFALIFVRENIYSWQEELEGGRNRFDIEMYAFNQFSPENTAKGNSGVNMLLPFYLPLLFMYWIKLA